MLIKGNQQRLKLFKWRLSKIISSVGDIFRVSGFIAEDNEEERLNGAYQYVIHFNKDQLPPVKLTWSIAVQTFTGDFVGDSHYQYSIGALDGVKYNADGSLDIYLQHTPPSKHKRSNWLPLPRGDFILTPRYYGPKKEILSGPWLFPEVKKLKKL